MTQNAFNRNQIFTIPELRDYLESMNAHECRIHLYGYYDDESSEDPIEQIFGIDETMQWINEHPAYFTNGETIGYLIVVFGRSVEEVIF